MNWYKQSQSSDLFHNLISLRPKIIESAQEIYDSWGDDDMISGDDGISDEIFEAIQSIVTAHIRGINISKGGGGELDEESRAWIKINNDQDAYWINIPHKTYETGDGFKWRKIPGVIFSINDLKIWKANIEVGDNL